MKEFSIDRFPLLAYPRKRLDRFSSPHFFSFEKSRSKFEIKIWVRNDGDQVEVGMEHFNWSTLRLVFAHVMSCCAHEKPKQQRQFTKNNNKIFVVMAEFEPESSCVGRDCSANCVTITIHRFSMFRVEVDSILVIKMGKEQRVPILFNRQ